MDLKLKELRKASGYTQGELADKIGATRRQVSAWERGENDLPMDYAYDIAELLGCGIDAIAGRIEYTMVMLNGSDEHELAEIYRSITPEGKRALMASARGIAATYSKNHKAAKAC